MNKYLKLCLIIFILIIFIVIYTLILLKIDYGVMPYDKYYGLNGEKTPCEPLYFDNGYTQLEDCAKYKLNVINLSNNSF